VRCLEKRNCHLLSGDQPASIFRRHGLNFYQKVDPMIQRGRQIGRRKAAASGVIAESPRLPVQEAAVFLQIADSQSSLRNFHAENVIGVDFDENLNVCDRPKRLCIQYHMSVRRLEITVTFSSWVRSLCRIAGIFIKMLSTALKDPSE
jgi:hypothetical protein